MEWTNFDPELSEALTIAIIRSIWISSIIWLLALLVVRGGVLRKAVHIYRFLIISTAAITGLTIHYFFQAYTSPGLTVDIGTWATTYTGGELSPNSTVGEQVSGQWPVMVWLLGFLIVTFRSAFGLVQLSKINGHLTPIPEHWEVRIEQLRDRYSVRLPVRSGTSDQVSVPLVYGILRPTIVFPVAYFSHMNPRELDAIIIHELIHIRKFDFLVNILQGLCEAVLFFNPVIWWLGHETRKYREFRVDDAVRTDPASTRDYAIALMKAGTLAGGTTLAGIKLYEGKNSLLERVHRMLGNSKGRVSHPIITFVFCICIAVILFAFKNHEDRKEILAASAEIELDNLWQTAETEAIVPDISKVLSTAFLRTHTYQDTVPNDTSLEEKQRLIEEKMLEMEAMQLELEEQIMMDMEPLTRQMEEWQVKFEKEMAPKLEAFEKEFIESELFVQMEELQDRYEDVLSDIEVNIDHAELEEKMRHLEEELSRKIDIGQMMQIDPDSLDPKVYQELELEMQALKEEMEETTREMSREMNEAMQNDELKEIMQEMQNLQIETEVRHLEREKIQKEMMQEYQLEMGQIQEEINRQMKVTQSELHQNLRNVAEEVRELKESLQKEIMQNFQEK